MHIAARFRKIFKTFYRLLITNTRLVDDYSIKSDEENIRDLLRTSEDKVKFQKAIDSLRKGEKESVDVDLNNRKITLSI